MDPNTTLVILVVVLVVIIWAGLKFSTWMDGSSDDRRPGVTDAQIAAATAEIDRHRGK